jgi:hypothetical protein
MKKKIIPAGVALVCSALFLILVLDPAGCGFNLIPFQIHESISRGGKNESLFIRVFDVLFSIAIFLIIFWILMLWKRT